MSHVLSSYLPFAFPIFFIAMWLMVSLVLNGMSGWFVLARRYPDRNERALLSFTGRSGRMGIGVQMNGILTVSACPSGLRVGMWRIFGPFSRDFLVPWDEIRVVRGGGRFWRSAKLLFGRPTAGVLTIPAHLANRLAQGSQGRWPEQGPFPQETVAQSLGAVLMLWVGIVAFGAAFFIVAPRLMSQGGSHPPIAVAFLLPAVMGAVAAAAAFLQRRG